jgi:hypothetical protein
MRVCIVSGFVVWQTYLLGVRARAAWASFPLPFPLPNCCCFGVWVHNQLFIYQTLKRERKGKERKRKNTREVMVAAG